MISTLLLSAVLLPHGSATQPAETIYREMRRRLDHARGISFTFAPTDPDRGDHTIGCGYERPNNAYRRGYGGAFETDGKWTWKHEEIEINRPARQGDMAIDLGYAAGLESFWAPHAKVKAIGDAKLTSGPEYSYYAPRKVWELNIEVALAKGKPYSFRIFVDPVFYLPLGSDAYCYFDIELNPVFPKGTFNFHRRTGK